MDLEKKFIKQISKLEERETKDTNEKADKIIIKKLRLQKSLPKGEDKNDAMNLEDAVKVFKVN